jgi:hypothetical protein
VFVEAFFNSSFSKDYEMAKLFIVAANFASKFDIEK